MPTAIKPKRRGLRISLTAGMIGLGLSGWSWLIEPQSFYRAYLPACLFWLTLPLGSLAIMMVHQLTGGAWGEFIRVPLKTAAATLPLAPILFLPLMLDLAAIFPWVNPGPELVGVVEKKRAYLNESFFLARTLFSFLIWLGLAAALGVWRRPSSPPAARPGLSAAGLLLYGLTITLFAVDWIMSLDPRWHSTGFALLIGSGPLVAALGFAIVVKAAVRPADTEPSQGDPWPDLGNLLLAAILLWGYLAFAHFLTIWSENLPEKILWYQKRAEGGWPAVSWTLATLHVFLPFSMLLSRDVKRRSLALSGVAALVLAGRTMDAYWLVTPAYYHGVAELSWREAAAFLGVGGVWLALFLHLLSRWRQEGSHG